MKRISWECSAINSLDSETNGIFHVVLVKHQTTQRLTK